MDLPLCRRHRPPSRVDQRAASREGSPPPPAHRHLLESPHERGIRLEAFSDVLRDPRRVRDRLHFPGTRLERGTDSPRTGLCCLAVDVGKDLLLVLPVPLGEHSLEPQGVDAADRIAADELVEVQLVLGTDRIAGEPAAEPGGVVAIRVRVKAGGAIAFLAGVADVAAGDVAGVVAGDEGAAAVGQVLLVGDQAAGARRARGRWSLAASSGGSGRGPGRRCRPRGRGCRRVTIDHGDAAFAVGDVRGPALEHERAVAMDAHALLVAEVDDLAGLDDGDTAGDQPGPSLRTRMRSAPYV